MWASWLNFVFAIAFIGVATAAMLSTSWVYRHQHQRTA
jgi:hypothetical protein